MTKKYKVVISRPGGIIEIAEIPATLEGMQNAVGGHLEMFFATPSGLDFFCNEDGKCMNLMPNKFFYNDVIVGNILVTSHNDDGETVSLSFAQIDEAVQRLYSLRLA